MRRGARPCRKQIGTVEPHCGPKVDAGSGGVQLEARIERIARATDSRFDPDVQHRDRADRSARTADDGRDPAVGQDLARSIGVRNAEPCRKLRPAQRDLPNLISGTVALAGDGVRLAKQLHQEMRLVECGAAVVEDDAARTLLQPEGRQQLDVVADILIDRIDVVVERARQLLDDRVTLAGRRARRAAIIGERIGRRDGRCAAELNRRHRGLGVGRDNQRNRDQRWPDQAHRSYSLEIFVAFCDGRVGSSTGPGSALLRLTG